MAPDNSKIIKGFAFQKAVLEILKRKNYSYKEDILTKTEKLYYNRYDAIFFGRLDLSDFGLPTIYGDKIVVEFKTGRIGKEPIEHFLRQTQEQFDAVVFFFANNTPKEIKELYRQNDKYHVHFIDHDMLIKNADLKALLSDFDGYIVQKDNLLIDDNYQLLKSNKDRLSFALGAGCSIASNISDWEKLSKALGYELLYSLVDKNDSAFKNMLLTNELNNNIFSCYEKNSALDAIYTCYSSSPSVKKADYWMAIKKVLYMSYNSPIDAENKLITAIKNCVARNNVTEVINYNFDSVLEQNIKVNYKSTSSEIENSITKLNGCTIYHVHGYIPYDYNGKSDVNNLVFTDNEYYENMMKYNSFCNDTQRRILNNYNTVFVGVSFTDQNMKEILRDRIKKGSNTLLFGFLKLPSFSLAGTGKELVKNKYKFIQQCYFDSLGVKIIWVDDYSDIPLKIDAI